MRRLDPQARALLAERIVEARKRREHPDPATTAGMGVSPPGGAPALPGTLSQEEIRGAVKAVLPLLAECFGEAQPRLKLKEGKLMVKMKLTGEPDVGTVVDAHGLEGEPAVLIDDVEFARCWRETMNSIEFPPLAAGGEVEVNYPFVVSAGEDDGT
jgi:hypothetical protein